MTTRDALYAVAALAAALVALLILTVLTQGFVPPAAGVGGPGWDTSPLQDMLGNR